MSIDNKTFVLDKSKSNFKPQLTPEFLRSFSKEHLCYEINSLFSTVAFLHGHNATDEWGKCLRNTFIEVIALKLRILYNFLFQEADQKDDAIAGHFFTDPQAWQKLRLPISDSMIFVRSRVGKEIAHLTYSRMQVIPEEKLPEILNLEEIKTLLRYAKEVRHHYYPVWALALFTGMRSGELYALDWTSVDFENKVIYVHRNWTSKTGIGPTKGRYWRAVPIGPQLVEFLKTLKLSSKDSKFVLPRFQSWTGGRQAMILRQFCEGSGIPSVKFHTLRACFATQLIKDGVAPAVVMKIAGWKDLKTMQRYIRLAGIEVKGATDGLKLLPENDVMGRVFELFRTDR